MAITLSSTPALAASSATAAGATNNRSLLRTGVAAITAGQEKAARAATAIVDAGVAQSIGTEPGLEASLAASDATIDITEAAVELLEAKTQVQAAAAVIRTADETLGSLIDTLA